MTVACEPLIRYPVGTASIREGTALHLPLRDESVDLIVTSPPYFALRSYTDGGEHYDGQIGSEATPQAFLEALWAVTAECRRVLKPSGSLWVNLGDKYSGFTGTKPVAGRNVGGGNRDEGVVPGGPKSAPMVYGIPNKSLMGLPWRYAIGCIDDLDLILRAEVIWSKPNGLPESVTDRVRRSHEQWFHFTKEPRYFAAVDEVREPHGQPERSTGATETGSGKRASLTDATNGMFSGERVRDYNPLGKLPGSVWTIPSEPLKVPAHVGVDHFAAYPQEWPRRIILGWSPPGGVILDPFGGTGTTAMVARALGRYGISIDLSRDYLKLARWRVWKSGHEYKTYARSWAEANGAMVDGKPKVSAAIKRQIEAEMKERAMAGRVMEKAEWEKVKADG